MQVEPAALAWVASAAQPVAAAYPDLSGRVRELEIQ